MLLAEGPARFPVNLAVVAQVFQPAVSPTFSRLRVGVRERVAQPPYVCAELGACGLKARDTAD